jgi:hypothetical protein
MATSSAHCGACGIACPSGTTCVVGRCSTPTFAGYTVTAPPASVVWVDACAAPGRTTALAGADDELFDGDLPFPVSFWGGRNLQYLLSPNGAVGFGTLYYNITAIPGTGPVRSWGTADTRIAPAVYLFGVDLVAGPTGICVATTGSAPNRTWVAEYLSAQLYVSTPSGGGIGTSAYTFELLAYEANANLDVLYNTPFLTPFGVTLNSPDPILVAVQDYRTRTRVAPYTGTVTATTRVRFSPM